MESLWRHLFEFCFVDNHFGNLWVSFSPMPGVQVGLLGFFQLVWEIFYWSEISYNTMNFCFLRSLIWRIVKVSLAKCADLLKVSLVGQQQIIFSIHRPIKCLNIVKNAKSQHDVFKCPVLSNQQSQPKNANYNTCAESKLSANFSSSQMNVCVHQWAKGKSVHTFNKCQVQLETLCSCNYVFGPSQSTCRFIFRL